MLTEVSGRALPAYAWTEANESPQRSTWTWGLLFVPPDEELPNVGASHQRKRPPEVIAILDARRSPERRRRSSPAAPDFAPSTRSA